MINNDIILGAVGVLQFDVVQFRLKDEYGVDTQFEPVQVNTARWVRCADRRKFDEFCHKNAARIAIDHKGDTVYLASSSVNLQMTQERWPEIEFSSTREHGQQAG